MLDAQRDDEYAKNTTHTDYMGCVEHLCELSGCLQVAKVENAFEREKIHSELMH